MNPPGRPPLLIEILFLPGPCPTQCGRQEYNHHNPMLHIIAETAGLTGNLHVALGATAAAIGVAAVGTKAVEAVGRNPGASGKILVQSILGMALAEAIAFYVIFLVK